MNWRHIEEVAKLLQRDIWRQRSALGYNDSQSPHLLLEPEIAAQVMGVDYQVVPRIGAWGSGTERFEIAGLLDRQRNVIRVSEKFRRPVMRFTGAHEDGHVALDHPGHVIHRDRPILGIERHKREPPEQEADYFAACFLAPERLVVKAVRIRFGNALPLRLDEAVAFNLGQAGAMLMGANLVEAASTLAGASAFGGRHFVSLADAFGISVSAMAYRLMELGLIEQ